IQKLHPNALQEAVGPGGLSPSRLFVLPNCVPPRTPSRPRDELRREFGYEPQDYVVLCAAAWNAYHKRIDYVIDEIARISDPRVELLLCGQDEHGSYVLKRQAARLLDGRVQWLTLEMDRVVDAMEAADVFVLASLAEALGNVVIEAAVQGVPVICHP